MPAWQPRNIAEALISFRDFNVRFGGGRGVSRATVRYVRLHLIAIILGRPLKDKSRLWFDCNYPGM